MRSATAAIDAAGLGLAGRHVLVTGGSRGIGRAITIALAGHGARVTACYARPGPAVDSLAADLAGAGAEHLVAKADVTSAAELDALVAQATDRFGEIHGIVNNAGVVSHRLLEDLDDAEWQRVLDTNLGGMYRTVRAALPHLADGASIVNVTSAVAFRGMAARAHYTAAKAGVTGLTRSLAKELGPRGVRVNSVAPGLVETDQMAGVPEAARTRYTGMIALGRIADPAELAGPVAFLLSDMAGYVTGATLHVDGGI
jgi:3-oxoacyl-[acyl-carrier protein] reductase